MDRISTTTTKKDEKRTTRGSFLLLLCYSIVPIFLNCIIIVPPKSPLCLPVFYVHRLSERPHNEMCAYSILSRFLLRAPANWKEIGLSWLGLWSYNERTNKNTLHSTHGLPFHFICHIQTFNWHIIRFQLSVRLNKNIGLPQSIPPFVSIANRNELIRAVMRHQQYFVFRKSIGINSHRMASLWSQ